MFLKGLACIGCGILVLLFSPISVTESGAEDTLPYATPLEAPPYEVINVARPDFGLNDIDGDYGLVNDEPLEVGLSVGKDRNIRIVRTPRELRTSRRNEAFFRLRLGNVEHIYFWLESPPITGFWNGEVTAIYADGYREGLFSDTLLRDGVYFLHVPPGILVEFRLTSHDIRHDFIKRFIFTISPVHLSLWKDFQPIPYTRERFTHPR